MAITATAPRGGIVEEIDGVTYTLLLRCREIERFEDMHRGIFDVWEGFFGRANKPTSKEVRHIIALALVGGGKKDADADRLVENATPADLFRFYQISSGSWRSVYTDAFDEANSKKTNKRKRTKKT